MLKILLREVKEGIERNGTFGKVSETADYEVVKAQFLDKR
jgi:hypothetical protein